MIKKEEKAQQHFKELKHIFSNVSSGWWKKNFKHHIDKFIEELLSEKKFISGIPCEDEKDEEVDCVYLHGVRCLVAGAIQEWELVQQPNHAAVCVDLDGALVWQGRGYVSPMMHAISSLQPPVSELI